MNWSWKLIRVGGIDIRMHWTFLLILAWVGFSQLAAGSGISGALFGIGFVLCLFLCVVLHEFGHAIAARSYGISTRDITLLPIGGLARLERMPKEPKQELVVAIAGPLVNVAIAAGLSVGLLAIDGLNRLSATPAVATSTGGFLANLLWVNVALVIFNLLPAFPMDGGRILRAFLAMRFDYVHATRIAASVGQSMAILFGFLGLFVNPFLLFIALFVFIGAEGEARQAQFQDLLVGVPLGRAMMTEFHSLRPDDSLRDAADLLLSGSQTDFPVVDDSGFRGMLRRADLIKGLKDGGPDRRVDEAMTAGTDFARESDALEDTITRMRDSAATAMPVMNDGRIVGLVSMENISELVMLRSAMEGQRVREDLATNQAV